MQPARNSAPESRLSRRDKAFLAFLTLTCCATAASCWWYYGVEARATEAAAARTIFAVSEGKLRQIWNWRRERIGDGEVVMSASTLSRASHILEGSAAAQQDSVLLREVLQRLCRAFLYSDAAVVDLNGDLALHLNATDPEFGRDRRAALAREANAANDVVLSDLTNFTRTRRPLMALSIPVRNQGAIIMDIDPARFLYPYLASWPDGGQSAETFILRLDGNQILDLSPRRYAPHDRLLSHRPQQLRIPSPDVLEGGWNALGPDYRNVPVIATVRHIPDSPWYLVVKIDRSEVIAPLRRLAWDAALLTGLIALVNTSGGALIVRRTRDRWHREREALFYSVANDTPAYLWMESTDGSGCFLNQPLCEFLRSASGENPKSWLRRLHLDDRDRVSALHSRARSQARGYTTEARIRCFDGQYRVVLIDALPQFSTGRFSGFAGCLADITDRRTAEEQLRVANATLQRELEARIRKEEEIRTLSARLIDAREEERKHLARELHDGLNQQIAGVSIAIGNLKRSLAPEQRDACRDVDTIHRRLVEVSENVRLMSHELHPALLGLRGLGAAVQSCCDEFSVANGLEVSQVISGSFEDITSSAALCVFRVLQEALRNVVRHAQTASVCVSLVRSSHGLELTVSDQGVGFEVTAMPPRTGLGLISMEERARLIGGVLTIRSGPGQGTTLKVTIPLTIHVCVESEDTAQPSLIP